MSAQDSGYTTTMITRTNTVDMTSKIRRYSQIYVIEHSTKSRPRACWRTSISFSQDVEYQRSTLSVWHGGGWRVFIEEHLKDTLISNPAKFSNPCIEEMEALFEEQLKIAVSVTRTFV